MLSREQLDELVDAATRSGLGEGGLRGLLFDGIPDTVWSGWPRLRDAHDQLQSDVAHLTAAAPQRGTERPLLAIWLGNAYGLRATHPEGELFRRLQGILDGRSAPPAPPPTATIDAPLPEDSIEAAVAVGLAASAERALDDAEVLEGDDLLLRAQPMPARLRHYGDAFRLLGVLDLQDEDSEQAHDFSIQDALDHWRVNQKGRYPDGTVVEDRGVAHEGGAVEFTVAGLEPGHDLLLVRRADHVHGEYRVAFSVDGEPAGELDCPGSDRRFRWRNWPFRLPGRLIRGATARVRQSVVTEDREVNLFRVWIYQAEAAAPDAAAASDEAPTGFEARTLADAQRVRPVSEAVDLPALEPDVVVEDDEGADAPRPMQGPGASSEGARLDGAPRDEGVGESAAGAGPDMGGEAGGIAPEVAVEGAAGVAGAEVAEPPADAGGDAFADDGSAEALVGDAVRGEAEPLPDRDVSEASSGGERVPFDLSEGPEGVEVRGAADPFDESGALEASSGVEVAGDAGGHVGGEAVAASDGVDLGEGEAAFAEGELEGPGVDLGRRDAATGGPVDVGARDEALGGDVGVGRGDEAFDAAEIPGDDGEEAAAPDADRSAAALGEDPFAASDGPGEDPFVDDSESAEAAELFQPVPDHTGGFAVPDADRFDAAPVDHTAAVDVIDDAALEVRRAGGSPDTAWDAPGGGRPGPPDVDIGTPFAGDEADPFASDDEPGFGSDEDDFDGELPDVTLPPSGLPRSFGDEDADVPYGEQAMGGDAGPEGAAERGVAADAGAGEVGAVVADVDEVEGAVDDVVGDVVGDVDAAAERIEVGAVPDRGENRDAVGEAPREGAMRDQPGDEGPFSTADEADDGPSWSSDAHAPDAAAPGAASARGDDDLGVGGAVSATSALGAAGPASPFGGVIDDEPRRVAALDEAAADRGSSPFGPPVQPRSEAEPERFLSDWPTLLAAPDPGARLALPADLVARARTALRAGRPLLLVGPAGVGKTTLARRLAGVGGHPAVLSWAALGNADALWQALARHLAAAAPLGHPGVAGVVVDDLDLSAPDPLIAALLAALRGDGALPSGAAVVATARGRLADAAAVAHRFTVLEVPPATDLRAEWEGLTAEHGDRDAEPYTDLRHAAWLVRLATPVGSGVLGAGLDCLAAAAGGPLSTTAALDLALTTALLPALAESAAARALLVAWAAHTQLDAAIAAHAHRDRGPLTKALEPERAPTADLAWAIWAAEHLTRRSTGDLPGVWAVLEG